MKVELKNNKLFLVLIILLIIILLYSNGLSIIDTKSIILHSYISELNNCNLLLHKR